MVNKKMQLNKNKARNKGKENKGDVLSQPENKKFELQILEFNQKLAILKVSKNEIQKRLHLEKLKLSIIQQKIRDIGIYCEKNAFDFQDIP